MLILHWIALELTCTIILSFEIQVDYNFENHVYTVLVAVTGTATTATTTLEVLATVTTSTVILNGKSKQPRTTTTKLFCTMMPSQKLMYLLLTVDYTEVFEVLSCKDIIFIPLATASHKHNPYQGVGHSLKCRTVLSVKFEI